MDAIFKKTKSANDSLKKPLDRMMEISKSLNQGVENKINEIKEKTVELYKSKETKEEGEKDEQNEQNEKSEKGEESEEEEEEEETIKIQEDEDSDSEQTQNKMMDGVKEVGEKIVKPFMFLFYMKYFLIFAIILFLGLNIFAYVGSGKDFFRSFIDNFFMKFLYRQNDHIRNLLGLPKIIDEEEEEEEDSPNKISKSNIPKSQSNLGKAVETEKSINRQTMNKQESEDFMKKLNSFEPDQARESTIQNNLKSGWCYIGNDRGFRSCIEVKDSDVCISGNIFPSKDICINPSLRE